MTTSIPHTTVAVIGGGVVGAAIAHTLSHRGVDVTLLEADDDLAYQASGTNSGILHTGFDSTPGELETELILRAGRLRPAVVAALGVPVRQTGAVLVPRAEGDSDVIRELAENAACNGVDVSIRSSDGALVVPGESITDPVAFTLALAASAAARGARVMRGARVVGIDGSGASLSVSTADGRCVVADRVVNAAGLHADAVARLVGDDSFEIYPRKGEFFVFEGPQGRQPSYILLPVPTKRTKGVLVFPTLDGRVVCGPTAHDQSDKDDWSVRPDAHGEVLDKAVAQYPELSGFSLVATYAGLRPAGRDVNYVIGASTADARLVNVAAIRSTGLTASLGIADRVAEILGGQGIEVGELESATPVPLTAEAVPWWRRTARHAAASRG